MQRLLGYPRLFMGAQSFGYAEKEEGFTEAPHNGFFNLNFVTLWLGDKIKVEKQPTPTGNNKTKKKTRKTKPKRGSMANKGATYEE